MFEHEGQTQATTSRSRSLKRRMTWTEQRLQLRKLDLNFRRQAPIGRYFADFACHAQRLVIEMDGGVHERLEAVQLRDVERQAWLERQGYRVIRFTDRQVRDDVHACAEAVQQHVALLLDGGGLGGGVAAEVVARNEAASAPNSVIPFAAVRAPQSPTFFPSRGKGA